MWARGSVPLFVTALLGCNGCNGGGAGDSGASEGQGSADGGGGAESDGATGGGGPAGSGSSGLAVDPGVALVRGASHDNTITEAWLDPRASAALSLDAGGGVRLWPTLPPATQDLAALAPVRVPMLAPLTLSLARTSAGGFVIAGIDTVQAARVIAVEIDDQGEARVHERFHLAPDDPLLELHVLDGGERLLALGVDHSLRLYDGHGALITRFDQYGFSPWQLRFAGPPEDLKIAVVLAGPTRLQRLRIVRDSGGDGDSGGERIELVGEAHPVVLDRGPNQNDLALLPSGTHAAVFRRPKAKTTQWSLELHDLETGAVRILWGEVEGKHRGRVHIVDDDHALIEDGSGAGFWVDLSPGQGALMPEPFERPKTLEELPPESRVDVRRVELAGGTGSVRRRTSVVAGLRIVPTERSLLLQPLEPEAEPGPEPGPEAGAPAHFRLTQSPRRPMRLALDRKGELLAMSLDDDAGLVVEVLADGTHVGVAGCNGDSVTKLAFTDPEHLLIVGKDRAQICAWRPGKVVSEVALPEHEYIAVHQDGPGAGELGLMLDAGDLRYGGEDPPQVSAIGFSDNVLAELETLAEAPLRAWPELDQRPETLGQDGEGRRYTLSNAKTRQFNIIPAEGDKRSIQVADVKQTFEEFVVAPDGSRAAIVHAQASEYEYEEYGYYDYSPPSRLSVWDLAGETPSRAWSIPGEWNMQLSWSGDGSRLALRHGGGAIVVGPQGEVLYDLQQGELELEVLPAEGGAGETP